MSKAHCIPELSAFSSSLLFFFFPFGKNDEILLDDLEGCFDLQAPWSMETSLPFPQRLLMFLSRRRALCHKHVVLTHLEQQDKTLCAEGGKLASWASIFILPQRRKGGVDHSSPCCSCQAGFNSSFDLGGFVISGCSHIS